MSTLYLDPNYEPESSYLLLEGLLLLFRNVYVYAPNEAAIKRAHHHDRNSLTPEMFLDYVRRGFLTPIAGSWYWTQEKRRDRVKRILSEGKDSASSQARAQLFKWTQFDDEICGLVDSKDRCEDRMYDAATWCERLPEHSPEAFAEVRPKIAHLYKTHKLAEEFYQDEFRNTPKDHLYAKVVRNFVGDAAVCGFRHITTQLYPRNSEPLVSAISDLTQTCPYLPEPISGTSGQYDYEIDLSEEDFRLAQDFTRELASKHALTEIIGEYHDSKLSRAFRYWVVAVLNSARMRGKDLSEALRESFNAEVTAQKREEQLARTLGSPVLAGVVAKLLSDRRAQEFLNSLFRRRDFLKSIALVGPVAIGALLGSDVAGRTIPAVIAEIRNTQWIALVSTATRRDVL